MSYEELKEAEEQMERQSLFQKRKDSIAPDVNLIEGNEFFFVIDMTPHVNGTNKITFKFIDFMSKYFVGSTIYLIGMFDSYPNDFFFKFDPNVNKLQPKHKKILNSYIAHSRRFYTFSYEYAKWAAEQNINGCTLFVPEGMSTPAIHGVDICDITGNVGSDDMIPEN
jgi:hypothetical protein